jgi:hypothetical protein
MHASGGRGGLTVARFMVPLAMLAGVALAASEAAAAALSFQGENRTRPDIDTRQGKRAPSSTQRAGDEGSDQDLNVRAAELQVFAR